MELVYQHQFVAAVDDFAHALHRSPYVQYLDRDDQCHLVAATIRQCKALAEIALTRDLDINTQVNLAGSLNDGPLTGFHRNLFARAWSDPSEPGSAHAALDPQVITATIEAALARLAHRGRGLPVSDLLAAYQVLAHQVQCCASLLKLPGVKSALLDARDALSSLKQACPLPVRVMGLSEFAHLDDTACRALAGALNTHLGLFGLQRYALDGVSLQMALRSLSPGPFGDPTGGLSDKSLTRRRPVAGTAGGDEYCLD